MARVLVIGGAAMDMKARATRPFALHTTTSGYSTLSAGGMGRNLAELLARLGDRVQLVSAIGEDDLGERLMTVTRAAGVDVSHLRRRIGRTSTYMALLDHQGELLAGIADTAMTDTITPLTVQSAVPLIADADAVVLDGSINVQAIRTALDIARDYGTRMVVAPAGPEKARLLAGVLSAARPVRLITPNREELAAITDMPVGTRSEIAAAAHRLRGLGVNTVYVALGLNGGYIVSEDIEEWQQARVIEVADITGMGSAFTAAYMHYREAGLDRETASRLGHTAAVLTLESTETVRQDMSETLLQDNLRRWLDLPLIPSTIAP